MNDEEIKAIERCNELIKESHSCWIGITNQVAIQTVLNLIEKQKADIEEYKAKLEYKQYNDLDNIEFEKYIEKIVKERTEKLYKGIETLKRDFEIVDHECSRLEQEDIRKDKIINDAIKWIENTMNDSRVTGCNLGDLQLLLDILKDKK